MTAHPALGAMQMRAVGSPQPVPEAPAVPRPIVDTIVIHDLGIRESAWPSPRQPHGDPALGSIGGWSAIYQAPVKPNGPWRYPPVTYEGPEHLAWFAQHWSLGGGHGTTSLATRNEAVAAMLADALHAWLFWEQRVSEMQNGDTSNGYPIIRCNGLHYTLGDHGRDIRGNGCGGGRFRFRMLADGREVVSRNVWVQGEVPTEYRDILVNNAEAIH